jgi:hypothetical protein
MTDGVALQACDHPVENHADLIAWCRTEAPRLIDEVRATGFGNRTDKLWQLVGTFLLLVDTDLNEASLTNAVIEIDDAALIEAFAIRCALGNNGGEWLAGPDGSSHYTEEQKEVWRQFVRDLIRAIQSGAAPSNYGKPSMPITAQP